jgi:hypothetical protein
MTNDESAASGRVRRVHCRYQKDRRSLQLIIDYAQRYENLSDEMARTMIDDYLDLESDRLAVRQKYVRKFDDVLAPKKLARFIQVENKLNAITQIYLADEIPLVQ